MTSSSTWWAEQVADGSILNILREFLSAGVMEDFAFLPTLSGTPQGGVIFASPGEYSSSISSTNV